jgi:hypothetical protein
LQSWPGTVPATHGLLLGTLAKKGVDAGAERGHDGVDPGERVETAGSKPDRSIGDTFGNPTGKPLAWRGRRLRVSGYAGGSWRPSWHVRLGAAMRGHAFDRELADQDFFNGAGTQAGQNPNHNGHAPARRAGLPDMVVQFVVVHGVPVNGAVGMDMGHNMRFRMRAVRLIGCVLVVRVVDLARRAFRSRDERTSRK